MPFAVPTKRRHLAWRTSFGKRYTRLADNCRGRQRNGNCECDCLAFHHGPTLEFRLCPRFLFRLASIVVVKLEYQHKDRGGTIADHRHADH